MNSVTEDVSRPSGHYDDNPRPWSQAPRPGTTPLDQQVASCTQALRHDQYDVRYVPYHRPRAFLGRKRYALKEVARIAFLTPLQNPTAAREPVRPAEQNRGGTRGLQWRAFARTSASRSPARAWSSALASVAAGGGSTGRLHLATVLRALQRPSAVPARCVPQRAWRLRGRG
eukprot:scaffold4990_cov387-Prasinococcus_capsulatus_cf.AAC.34